MGSCDAPIPREPPDQGSPVLGLRLQRQGTSLLCICQAVGELWSGLVPPQRWLHARGAGQGGLWAHTVLGKVPQHQQEGPEQRPAWTPLSNEGTNPLHCRGGLGLGSGSSLPDLSGQGEQHLCHQGAERFPEGSLPCTPTILLQLFPTAWSCFIISRRDLMPRCHAVLLPTVPSAQPGPASLPTHLGSGGACTSGTAAECVHSWMAAEAPLRVGALQPRVGSHGAQVEVPARGFQSQGMGPARKGAGGEAGWGKKGDGRITG